MIFIFLFIHLLYYSFFLYRAKPKIKLVVIYLINKLSFSKKNWKENSRNKRQQRRLPRMYVVLKMKWKAFKIVKFKSLDLILLKNLSLILTIVFVFWVFEIFSFIQAAKDGLKKIPPNELFRKETNLYSQFDDKVNICNTFFYLNF